ncbi:IPP transferase-domain-containing protein [Piptocephalis cylindrospora]|uniref:tRNA dimethylallyltransferase n=1 Tax=Piptocephalis cylindrospora TaxID=1907219 RepID=A0A4P9Y7T1_9FUNG|nr:IPP transferase-domain-containing protein [Piptocephalis cylindrospora]|eukprot:RKP15123.1 IPP transferase-domain-containing protein [Piptocephalis cylindrospora]
MSLLTPSRPPVLAVIGTTGVGKSDLAVELAKALNGEVISTDSMQVYAGYDILTNKHPVKDQQGVPHHLLGYVPPGDNYSILDFTRAARQCIDQIHQRGRVPILVGGTQYYVQATLWRDQLVSDPSQSAEENSGPSHDKAEEEDPRTTEELYTQLQRVDPAMAERWHPRDRRKILRSLRVHDSTGQRHSDIQEQQRLAGAAEEKLIYPTCFLWLHAERSIIVDRLEARVDVMMQQGMLDEVRSLHRELPSPIDYTRGLAQGIGFKEFQIFIEAENDHAVDEKALEKHKADAVEMVKAGNRIYAKRQVGWIRNKLLPRCSPPSYDACCYVLDASDPSKWDEAAKAPAIAVAQAFLKQTPLPNPKDIHPLAQDLLNPPEKSPQDNKMIQCEICGVYSRGEQAARDHRGSRKHRQALKRQARPYRRSRPSSPSPS